ncbi:unnamed protein product, partial [Rotaria magnacalcarata]
MYPDSDPSIAYAG